MKRGTIRRATSKENASASALLSHLLAEGYSPPEVIGVLTSTILGMVRRTQPDMSDDTIECLEETIRLLKEGVLGPASTLDS